MNILLYNHPMTSQSQVVAMQGYPIYHWGYCMLQLIIQTLVMMSFTLYNIYLYTVGEAMDWKQQQGSDRNVGNLEHMMENMG